MTDKIFEFFINAYSREGFGGTVGIITAMFFLLYMLRSWLSPLFSKFNAFAQEKDIEKVDKDLNDGIKQIDTYQHTVHDDILNKLMIIEKLVETLEHSSRTNNLEIDEVRKDVDKIKTLLESYLYFHRGQ